MSLDVKYIAEKSNEQKIQLHTQNKIYQKWESMDTFLQ